MPANIEQALRVFVGLEMPPALRATLAALQQRLTASGLPLRPVRPEGIHLTLAFIGEIPASRVPAVIVAARRAVVGLPQLDLKAEGVGAFPNIHRPRAIWVGVGGDPADRAALHSLYNNIQRELRDAHFAVDAKFDPHLTIARVREHATPAEIAAIAQAVQTLNLPAPIAFTIANVYVIRSVLQAGGSIYSHIAAIPLALEREFSTERTGDE